MRFGPSSRPAAAGLAAAVALGCFAACGRREPQRTAPPPEAVAAATPQSSRAPHGDHNPHHGGLVMMKGDLHYEVVLDPSGRSHRLYFTDAVRDDLPASVASAVTLTIRRPKAAEESVRLQIDDAGESWQGSSLPVNNPADTTVRVAFTLTHDTEPYWIDLPFASR